MTQVHPDKIHEHLSGYQARDREIVDYRMYELGDTRLSFRGPPPDTLTSGDYFTCIGAAQTFGCFCPSPYPDLLSKHLGLPVLNLGYGGAGPEFFLRHEALWEYINRGRFAVLQVMSARSQSNSEFDSGGLELLQRRRDGKIMGARQAYDELIRGQTRKEAEHRARWQVVGAKLAAHPKVRLLVRETRSRWVESYRELLSRISVPTVLFWFSRRTPAYHCGYRNVSSLFGEFPQLVTGAMVDEVRGYCSDYAACIGSRGHPQLLISRHTGDPVTVDPADDRPDLGEGRRWTHNHYYPSPKMQEDACATLMSACTRLARHPK